MAEQTGLRNNALPYPIYAQPFGIVFPLLDADGDPISPSSPDSEKSLNGDTFADCTNEATEIATSTGICYLLLTAAEMTADVVAVRIQSTGAKTTVITLYPRKLVTLRTGTAQAGAAGTITLDSGASAVDDFYNGCVVAGVLDTTNEVRVITDYVGSTKVASVTPNWNTTPDSDDTFTIYLPEGRQINQANVTHLAETAQTARDIGASVLLSSGTGTGQVKLASGYVAPNWGDVGNPTTTVSLTNTTVATVTTTTTATNVTTVNGLAANVITAASIATGAIDADALATDAVDEIWEYATTNITAAGGIGKLIIDNLDATVSSRGTSTLTQTQVTGGAYALNSASFAFHSGLDLTTTQKASVNTEADTALTDYDPPTNAEMEARTIVAASYATASALDAVDNFVDTEITTLTTELAKVPKSDGTVSWNATALAAINAQADLALADYDGPTNAEMEARTIAAASYATATALATVDTVVDAIQAKTDSLTFTVAAKLDVNVLYVNGTQVTGAGTTGDPWGP